LSLNQVTAESGALTAKNRGQPDQVSYAAEAPSLTAGVIQIDATIPAGVSNNQQVPVSWSAGTYSSQAGTTIAVK
jgi:uncharacterized protein (TIGR03437 family)